MTVLLDTDRGFRLLSRRQPRAWTSLVAMTDLVWQGPGVDVCAMELCRLRIAGLLGADAWGRVRAAAALDAGLPERSASRPGDYPSSTEFSKSERACLAYAEQVLRTRAGLSRPPETPYATSSATEGWSSSPSQLACSRGLPARASRWGSSRRGRSAWPASRSWPTDLRRQFNSCSRPGPVTTSSSPRPPCSNSSGGTVSSVQGPNMSEPLQSWTTRRREMRHSPSRCSKRST